MSTSISYIGEIYELLVYQLRHECPNLDAIKDDSFMTIVMVLFRYGPLALWIFLFSLMIRENTVFRVFLLFGFTGSWIAATRAAYALPEIRAPSSVCGHRITQRPCEEITLVTSSVVFTICIELFLLSRVQQTDFKWLKNIVGSACFLVMCTSAQSYLQLFGSEELFAAVSIGLLVGVVNSILFFWFSLSPWLYAHPAPRWLYYYLGVRGFFTSSVSYKMDERFDIFPFEPHPHYQETDLYERVRRRNSHTSDTDKDDPSDYPIEFSTKE